jgi:glycosyltransferase involved in cell wall biosynthesis
MLEPWALNFRKFKKSIALATYQRQILMSASAFFATSEMERESIRKLGLTQPTYVIPNGVTPPPNKPIIDQVNKPKRALFLSRIHPKKGLVNLVGAWARARPTDWKLTIAGPDELDHQKEVEQLVRRFNLEDVIDFAGDLDGEKKDETYRNSNLFILPSYSENFGIVVLEAMAYGIPVITTKGTPWAILEEQEAGWWIEANEDSLLHTLNVACALPATDLRIMGNKCKIIADQFSWPTIANSVASAYQAILKENHLLT